MARSVEDIMAGRGPDPLEEVRECLEKLMEWSVWLVAAVESGLITLPIDEAAAARAEAAKPVMH